MRIIHPYNHIRLRKDTNDQNKAKPLVNNTTEYIAQSYLKTCTNPAALSAYDSFFLPKFLSKHAKLPPTNWHFRQVVKFHKSRNALQLPVLQLQKPGCSSQTGLIGVADVGTQSSN